MNDQIPSKKEREGQVDTPSEMLPHFRPTHLCLPHDTYIGTSSRERPMVKWIALISFSVIFNLHGALAQENCKNSTDDQFIVEYFNEISFEQEIEIIVTDKGMQFQILLSCPPPLTPGFPPSDFDLTMNYESEPVGSLGTTCGNQVPMVISKSDLLAGNIPSCTNNICRFRIVLNNRTTQTIYSETLSAFALETGGVTLNPPLEAATVPICTTSLSKCLLTDTCRLSTQPAGVLQLCDSGSSCTSPPNSTKYTYNENIYFQAAITEKVEGQ